MQPLQALTPVNVIPTTRRSSERMETTPELKRIDFIRVSSIASRGNSQKYVVEMFHSTPSSSLSSRIPAQNQLENETAAVDMSTSSSFCSVSLRNQAEVHKSEARVERSYADFLGLQAQLLHAVHVAHTMFPCQFCQEVTSAATWGGTHSSPLAMLMKTEDELATTFESFVNELLSLTKTRFSSKRGPCRVQARVPATVYEFLFGE